MNAASNRVEPFEIDVIKDFIKGNYRIIVVLTNADKMSLPKLDRMEEAIYDDLPAGIPVVRVCSVVEELGSGFKSTPFGAPKLQEETLRGFWYALTIRLPDRFEALLHQRIEDWCQAQVALISGKRTFFNRAEVREECERRLVDFQEEIKRERCEMISQEVRETVAQFRHLAELLNYPKLSDLPDIRRLRLNTDFVRKLQQMLLGLGSLWRKLANLLEIWSGRPPISDEVKSLCSELKSEITSQKPQIQRLIENMLLSEDDPAAEA